MVAQAHRLARTTDPSTSHAAAAKAAKTAQPKREAVYRALLRHGPCTAEALEMLLPHIPPSRVRTSLDELFREKRSAYVLDENDKPKTSLTIRGNPARLWTALRPQDEGETS